MSDYLPYAKHSLTPEDEQAVLASLRSGSLTQGEVSGRLEVALSQHTGAKYAIAVNSGTAALHLGYEAMKFLRGIQRVSMPAVSFVATANAAHHAHLGVSFVDTDPDTGLASGDVTVDLGGQDGGECLYLRDACHSFTYRGEWVGVVSLHPAKFATSGEGGAVLTNDPDVDRFCRLMRSHARVEQDCKAPGWNYRLSDLNAALALSQMARVPQMIERRQKLAQVYTEVFAHYGVPFVPHSEGSSRHLFSLLVEGRDFVQRSLHEQGIGTAIHYPVIPGLTYWRMHHQRAYRKPPEETFPNAFRFANRTLSLPLYPTLSDDDQWRVILAVKTLCAP